MPSRSACASDHVGEIESVSEFEADYFDGGTYECKGHVLKGDFARALKEQWNVEADADDVRHVYIRYVPYKDGISYRSMGIEEYRPKRGNSPRTSVEKRCCREYHDV